MICPLDGHPRLIFPPAARKDIPPLLLRRRDPISGFVLLRVHLEGSGERDDAHRQGTGGPAIVVCRRDAGGGFEPGIVVFRRDAEGGSGRGLAKGPAGNVVSVRRSAGSSCLVRVGCREGLTENANGAAEVFDSDEVALSFDVLHVRVHIAVSDLLVLQRKRESA